MRLSFRGRLMLASALTAAIGGVVCAGARAAERVPVRFRSPIAVAAISTGELLVLERSGGLVRFDPKAGRAFSLKDRFAGYLAIDIAASDVDESVLVTLTRSSLSTRVVGAGFRPTKIAQVSREGEEIELWNFLANGLFAGVAADLAHGTVYLSNSTGGEIARLRQTDPKIRGPVFFSRIPRSKVLGPLVIDPEKERLFVADPLQGVVYVVHLADRRTEQLADGLGEPLALALSSEHRRLFVADAARGLVWAVRTEGAAPSPVIFFDSPELRRPQGIAVTGDGKVWVSDSWKNRLVELSAEGDLLGTYP